MKKYNTPEKLGQGIIEMMESHIRIFNKHYNNKKHPEYQREIGRRGMAESVILLTEFLLNEEVEPEQESGDEEKYAV